MTTLLYAIRYELRAFGVERIVVWWFAGFATSALAWIVYLMMR